MDQQHHQWWLEVLLLEFQFTPSDNELVSYLKKRVSCGSCEEAEGLIVEFDIYTCDPWELPRNLFNYLSPEQREMYFFTKLHPVSSNNSGSHRKKHFVRTASSGVWHCNSHDRPIRDRSGAILGHTTGFKFEILDSTGNEQGGGGRSNIKKRRSCPNIKTDWLMREWRLSSTDSNDADDLVICKIYYNGKITTTANTVATTVSSYSSRASFNEQQQHYLQDQQQPIPKRRRVLHVEGEADEAAPAVSSSLLVRHPLASTDPVPCCAPALAQLPQRADDENVRSKLSSCNSVPVPTKQLQHQQELEETDCELAGKLKFADSLLCADVIDSSEPPPQEVAAENEEIEELLDFSHFLEECLEKEDDDD